MFFSHGRKVTERCHRTILTDAMHPQTSLAERGVRTLKENIVPNLKVGESYSKSLNLALTVMCTMPQSD